MLDSRQVHPVVATNVEVRMVHPQPGGSALASRPEWSASDRVFQVAFERAPIGIALADLDGRYVFANPAFCSLIGRPRKQLPELTVNTITHPDDIGADLEGMRALLADEIPAFTLDKRYLTAAGAVVWATKSTWLQRGADGAARHFIVQIQDLTQRKEDEHALAEERSRLHQAEVIGRMGSWEVDIATTTIRWSAAMFELRGLDRKIFGKEDWDAAHQLVHPDDRDRVKSAIAERCRTGESLLIRYRATRASDLALRWFDARAEGVWEGDRLVRLAGTVVDVTADVVAAEKAAAANAFQRAVITASPDIIFVYDLALRATVWSNRSISTELGYPAEDGTIAVDDLLARVVPPEDRLEFEATLSAARIAEGDGVAVYDHRLLDAGGNVRWFSRRMAVLHRDSGGGVAQMVGVLRDITEARGIEQRLQYSALHDGLTGLPNRTLLIDRLDVALARSKRDGREVTILFCDLDGFKRVNDTAGHAAGDAVLVETAQRLQQTLRASDTVARVGGDEFVIVLEPWNRVDESVFVDEAARQADDRARATRVVERLAEALRKPIPVNGIEHAISASIGVTYAGVPPGEPLRRMTADQVLQDADAAMYAAKKLGKDRYEVFEHSMRTDQVERGRVEQVLRQCLTREAPLCPTPNANRPQLSAAYQPIFDLDSGALVGFEALARLTDADGGTIAPDVFIKIAEDSGLIRPLGTRMLELACRQLAAWRRQSPALSEITMAVNVSALQAQHSSLSVDVCRTLAAEQLAPKDLVLELTENALLHASPATISALQTLRDEGVGIAIDDFGTGYASLRYLAVLPISSLKIDRSFTAGLPADRTSSKIVQAIVGLAADLELGCVVEGVETAAQRAALPAGVHLQGWLTGRPVSGEQTAITRLLAHGAPAS